MSFDQKSSVEEIRARFDADVERFSNLESGQTATIDAPLVLDLLTTAAARRNPEATHLLDVGCGAGNFTLKWLEHLPNRDVTLIDLSRPMLDRAVQRISERSRGRVTAIQADIREVDLESSGYDVIVAAMVLHHLRTDDEWIQVFRKFHKALKPGGSLWITDLITFQSEVIRTMMWERYADYLKRLKGDEYRDHVLTYIDREDTPRPLVRQVRDLVQAGFDEVEVLHVNTTFATFGAFKSTSA